MSAFPSSAEPTKGYASHEEACPVVQIKTIGTEQRNPNTLEIDLSLIHISEPTRP